MIKPKKVFLQVAEKANVVGFSNRFRCQDYDKVSQKLMDTVIIYVSKKVPLSQLSSEDLIPRYYEPILRKSLRYKVKEVGIVTAPPSCPEQLSVLQQNDVTVTDRVKRQDPVILGLSIAHRTITAGSLGMSFVEQSSGQTVWGSNGHVLTPDATLLPEQIEEKRIHQPGSHHQEPTQETLVGQYHWHKQIMGATTDCPIAGGIAKVLNGFSRLFQRNSRLQAISLEGKNKIDFGCYKADVLHDCILPDGLQFPGGFSGLLFAGSEQAGIICKAENIAAEGYQSTVPETVVKVGDVVFGSSFWGDYKTTVEDTDMSVQVGYGSSVAMFEDLILVKNEGVIKGGWSGSSFFLVD